MRASHELGLGGWLFLEEQDGIMPVFGILEMMGSLLAETYVWEGENKDVPFHLLFW